MDDQKVSSTDQKIQEKHLEQQAKLKRGIWISAAVIAIMLAIYLGKQWYEGDTSVNQEIEQAPSENVNQSSQQIEEARKAYMQTLADFEDSHLPLLQNQALIDWSKGEAEKIIALKDNSLNNFASSKFQSALIQIRQAISDTNALETRWQESYQRKIDESFAYLEQENINRARLAFSQASKIMPSTPNSEKLQFALDNFEKLLGLKRELSVAKIENNLDKQQMLLRNIIALEPEASEFQEALKKLNKDIQNRELSKALSSGRSALSQGQYALAEDFLNRAKSIAPNAPGVKSLQNALLEKQRQNSLNSRLSALNELQAQQRWNELFIRSKEDLQAFPNNQKIKYLHEKAGTIVKHQKRLTLFLDRPSRLADEGIRQAAIESVQQALPFALDSNSLSTQINQLAQLIDEAQAPVAVTISSDEKSYLLVLGVGHIGEVESKEIQLKPGSYTLEARREGYRSKRLNIEVSSNKDNSFYLACDEKI